MNPCTNCARPGSLTVCLECAERVESALRPLVPWTPFEDAAMPDDPVLRAEGFHAVKKNSRYTVWIRRPANSQGPLIHLSIKRNDKNPMHDWRDLQRIKNEILGPEEEAVELYPAESRLVDSANQYHLWSFKGMRVPFGYTERVVMEHDGLNGAKQREFEQKPTDTVSEEEFQKKAAVFNAREQERAENSRKIRSILDTATKRQCTSRDGKVCAKSAPRMPGLWCAACMANELTRLAVKAAELQ